MAGLLAEAAATTAAVFSTFAATSVLASAVTCSCKNSWSLILCETRRWIQGIFVEFIQERRGAKFFSRAKEVRGEGAVGSSAHAVVQYFTREYVPRCDRKQEYRCSAEDSGERTFGTSVH